MNVYDSRFGDTNPSNAAAWPAYWACFLAFFLLLQSCVLAVSIPRGLPPDELAHIDYVVDAAQSRWLLPEYADGEILASHQKNYLKHPPLYYSALGLLCKIAGLNPLADYVALRIASAGMVSLGFLLWLLAGRRFGLGMQGAVLMTLACCAIPMFSYLAGSINNDNLAYLGVAMWFYGLSRIRFDPHTKDAVGMAWFALGMIISFLTKATAAAFIVFFCACLLTMRWRDLRGIVGNRLYLTALATTGLVVVGYFAAATIVFGEPMPSPGTLYSIAEPSAPISLMQFSASYASSMWERMPTVMSHASIAPFEGRAVLFFYAMLVLPVLGWMAARPRARAAGADVIHLRLADAFVLGLACMVAVHIHVTYKGYLLTGLYAGWQPRYYLFAIPGIWLLMELVRVSAGLRAIVYGLFGICAAVSFWTSTPLLIAKQVTPVAQSVHIHRPASPGDESITILATRPKQHALGHVDEARLENGRLLVRGWTFDPISSRPAERIWIIDRSRFIGSAPVHMARPDVAKALAKPAAEKSGFSVSILGLPDDLELCRLDILAESSSGVLSNLQEHSCEPR